MQNIAIKVENDLNKQIITAAAAAKISKSELIRKAVISSFEVQNQSSFEQILSLIESQNQSLRGMKKSQYSLKVETQIVSDKVDFLIENVILSKEFSKEEKQEMMKKLNQNIKDIAIQKVKNDI